jgi:hypothetical protein
MRSTALLVPLGIVSLGACAGSNIARTETSVGAQYRQLTGARLRAAVIGRHFSFPRPDGLYSSPTCHRFHADGTYQSCGDRIRFHPGTYTMERDHFCATGGPDASCWTLYMGPGGDYLLRDIRTPPRADARVCISSLAGEIPPCA